MSKIAPTIEEIKEIEEHYGVCWESLTKSEKTAAYWQYRRMTDPPEGTAVTDVDTINQLLKRAFNRPD